MIQRSLIIGNWKMNGLLADELPNVLVRLIKGKLNLPFEMVVCPPFTLLQHVGKIVFSSDIALGAQDCHTVESGAHTGDVSPVMLKDIGCTYVILGHSERRLNHHESNIVVKDKATTALKAGLNVILCIGETEAERNSGKTLVINQTQLRNSMPELVEAANVAIAYEPVWAIGTGRTPTSSEIQDVHTFIRNELAIMIGQKAESVRIIYGGSMKSTNAREILALENVDGGLVGGASLKAEDFWNIAQSSPSVGT